MIDIVHVGRHESGMRRRECARDSLRTRNDSGQEVLGLMSLIEYKRSEFLIVIGDTKPSR